MGVLLRPNALLAAPIFAAYAVWPTRFSFRRTAILFVPAAIGFFAMVQVVYYGALGATRQHPLQSIMIFDLGGISHFAKENQYPVDWSDSENALLLNGCYQPTQWDIYWRLEPCEFVMGKIEREKGLFGTSAIPKAWLLAVLRHPLAYLQHRSAFMWNFLAADNLTMWLADVEHPTQQVFSDRRGLRRFGLAARCAQADAAVSSWSVAAGLHGLVLSRLATSRLARRRLRARCLRIGSDLRDELLHCRRRLRLSLWLLGGAGGIAGAVVALSGGNRQAATARRIER